MITATGICSTCDSMWVHESIQPCRSCKYCSGYGGTEDNYLNTNKEEKKGVITMKQLSTNDLSKFNGKTIKLIDTETSDGDITAVYIRFTDGTKIYLDSVFLLGVKKPVIIPYEN